MRLKNWSATPAGGKITLSGTNEKINKPENITGCKRIVTREFWYYERRWFGFGRLERKTNIQIWAEHPTRGKIDLS